MELSVREALSGITTVRELVRAFQSEDRCRYLLEAMVWLTGRICPACGYRRSIALTGRENGKRADPGFTNAQVELAGSSSRSQPARPCTRRSFRFGCGCPAFG
jgi:hypothetical protein